MLSVSGSTQMSCLTLTLRDDNVLEDTENLVLELATLDPSSEITNLVILDPSQIEITIADNDAGKILQNLTGIFYYPDHKLLALTSLKIIVYIDIRLFFVNDSPRVDDNRVSADFVVGSSFTSVNCRLTTRRRLQVDCKSYFNIPLPCESPAPLSSVSTISSIKHCLTYHPLHGRCWG